MARWLPLEEHRFRPRSPAPLFAPRRPGCRPCRCRGPTGGRKAAGPVEARTPSAARGGGVSEKCRSRRSTNGVDAVPKKKGSASMAERRGPVSKRRGEEIRPPSSAGPRACPAPVPARTFAARTPFPGVIRQPHVATEQPRVGPPLTGRGRRLRSSANARPPAATCRCHVRVERLDRRATLSRGRPAANTSLNPAPRGRGRAAARR